MTSSPSQRNKICYWFHGNFSSLQDIKLTKLEAVDQRPLNQRKLSTVNIVKKKKQGGGGGVSAQVCKFILPWLLFNFFQFTHSDEITAKWCTICVGWPRDTYLVSSVTHSFDIFLLTQKTNFCYFYPKSAKLPEQNSVSQKCRKRNWYQGIVFTWSQRIINTLSDLPWQMQAVSGSVTEKGSSRPQIQRSALLGFVICHQKAPVDP